MTAAPVHYFPFGNRLKNVVQKDRTPKKDFVLGVYASAVHARWRDANGKVLVQALAVASEPEIFWRGEGAEKIIRRIKLPEGVGTLEPASEEFNGPSGNALDTHILQPLGLKREDVWLCDCVPWSLRNPAQDNAIQKHYAPLSAAGLVPDATIPSAKDNKGIDDDRRKAILRELESSGAGRIILLGDSPIKWFISHFTDGWSNLAGFVRRHGYGQCVPVTINGREYQVLPLAHPRQIARLGTSSLTWYDQHNKWMESEGRKRKK